MSAQAFRLLPALLLAASLPLAAADAPDEAVRLRDEAGQIRHQADADLATAERECLQRFRVNDCIDDARKKRIAEVQRARAMETQARKLERAGREAAAAARQAEIRELPPPLPPASPVEVFPVQAPPPPSSSTEEQARVQAERAAQEADAARRRVRTQQEAAGRAAEAEKDRARYEERLRRQDEKAREAQGR